MDREKIIRIIDELIFEAQKEPTWKAENALRCLKKELVKEQEKAKVVFGRCKDGSFATECGHCGMYLDKAYSICPKCNNELDWNSNQS